MDPNACWNKIKTILDTREYIEDVLPHVVALAGWLDSGGFQPTDFDPELFGNLCDWLKLTGAK